MLRVTIDTNVLEGDMQRIRNTLVENLDGLAWRIWGGAVRRDRL